MKLTKYLFILPMLLLGFLACDDDENGNPVDGNGGISEKVAVSFAETGGTVLRNGGQVRIPIVLEKAASDIVRVSVSASAAVDDADAEEGIDFNLEEKVVNIAAGDTISYLVVNVIDNEEATADKTVDFTINSVYGAGVKNDVNQSYTLQITSNAFIEFEKNYWEMYENALENEVAENIQAGRFIPLTLQGELEAPATVVFEVVDSTAVEPTHFTVEKELTINPGDSDLCLEILPVDDDEANEDRFFMVRMKEVNGEALVLGQRRSCGVKIISDEVRKEVAWGKAAVTVNSVGEIEIPVSLDIAPEAPVSMTVLATNSSTAVEGVDYEIVTPQIVFSNAGEQVVKVNILRLVDDYALTLEFGPTEDKTVFVDADNASCAISIEGRPSFVESAVSVKEDAGSCVFTVNVPAVPMERTLKLEMETASGDGSIVTLPVEAVIVPVDASQVSFNVNVGFNADIAAEDLPVVNVKIVGVDDVVLADPVVASMEVLEWPYRRWWGTYTFSFRVWENNSWVGYNAQIVISNAGNTGNNDVYLYAQVQSNIFSVQNPYYWFIWDAENETISSLLMETYIADGIAHYWYNHSGQNMPVEVTPYAEIVFQPGTDYTSWEGNGFLQYLVPDVLSR